MKRTFQEKDTIINLRSLFLFTFIVFSKVAHTASCCGGGVGLPSLITGDFKFQVQLGMSQKSKIYNVFPKKTLISGEKKKYTTQTFNLNSSYHFKDFFQLGVDIPFIQNDFHHRSSSIRERKTGIGDVSLVGAWEFLPEKYYSRWRPRGFLYSSLLLPTGNPSQYSNTSLGSDVTGLGTWGGSLGVALIKEYTAWDFQLLNNLSILAPKKFNQYNKRRALSTSTAYETTTLVGFGFNLSEVRFGAGLSFHNNFPREVSIANTTFTTDQSFFWEGGLHLSYLFKNFSTLTFSFKDQTFFPAKNTTLSRTIALSFHKRFPY